MEMTDARLCSLAFQEYVSRKRVLELTLKMQTETNDSIKKSLEKEIEQLRNNADELNNLRNNSYQSNSNLLTK